jgi:DnaJ-class molecular chaperone
MQTVTTCPTCNGEGSTITAKCGSCKGEGRVYGEETVNIDIPAGVQEGMQLSISGRGNAGERGGMAGDLVIIIEEEPHKDLVREGLNVAYELYLSFPDAAFGTNVEVPTIDGRAKIKIPAGTQSGKVFRLKGKGFPAVTLTKKATSWCTSMYGRRKRLPPKSGRCWKSWAARTTSSRCLKKARRTFLTRCGRCLRKLCRAVWGFEKVRLFV